jgi:DNA-binding protein HU-beta
MGIMLKHQMSKAELAEHLAVKCGIAKEVVSTLLVELAVVAAREVKTNDVFALPGIGRIIKQERPERHGVNPMDGSPIRIPPRVKVTFQFAADFGKSILAD